MYNPSLLSAAALVGVAATQVAALKAGNNAIVEFRYCPPTKNSVERMQACVAQSRDSSLGTYRANSTAALYCEMVELLKDPIVTVLSTVLSEVHYRGEAFIGSENSAGCGELGPDPWTVVVNGSISPNNILESWSKYDEELYSLPEGAYVHPPAGSVPRVFPWMFCNLPIGVDYEQQCQDTLKFLWTPLGALEILFPWQFSQYCFLCWWWGTLMFDVVHWLLHKFSKSKSKFLRRIGRLHMVHHFYFDTTLTFNDKYAWHNSWVELPWEGVCLYTGSLISWYICKYFDLTDKPWGFTEDIFRKIVFTQACKTIYTMYYEGKDANHLTWPVVPKDPDFWMVGAEYHCLHHVQPDAYYSSLHRFFDQAIGASTSYKQKRITITGAGGAYGQALIKQLKGEKIRSLQVLTYGKDWTHDDFSGAIPKLVDTDVLILAHGTKGEDAMEANCNSAVKFIELFKKHRKQRDTWLPGRDGAKEKRLNSQMLPEVWYTGSEIEIIKASPKDVEIQRYSASKRAFARYARAYYDDTTFIYRHIVPAGFTSAMGKGLVSADWAASVTMFFILRGARYVPVTYTTMAYWNFFKFLYGTKPLKVGDEGAIKAVL